MIDLPRVCAKVEKSILSSAKIFFLSLDVQVFLYLLLSSNRILFMSFVLTDFHNIILFDNIHHFTTFFLFANDNNYKIMK